MQQVNRVVNRLSPNTCNEQVVLSCDLAGEHPLYIFLDEKGAYLLYSLSLTDLLEHSDVKNSLTISDTGMSFLLQCGVVPPPLTIYKNLFVVGIGDSAQVAICSGRIKLSFSHDFPFMSTKRLCNDQMRPSEDFILESIAQAVVARADSSKPSFLFHSAGKDSNTIALALAEAGWQDRFTLITHKAKSGEDEGEISAKIAKQLGFRHRFLREVETLDRGRIECIDEYFYGSPLPCVDNVSLAYPLYLHSNPDLRHSNIIDGGGNDTYMSTPLSRKDWLVFGVSRLLSRLAFLRGGISTESVVCPGLRTAPEWCGMSGLSLKDASSIFPATTSVYGYWQSELQKRSAWDLLDFKTDIYSTVTISEMHIRKARNFCDAFSSNLIMPFADPDIAQYFSSMPESYLVDRKKGTNKLLLRHMLKERIGLDSDSIGKKGWVVNHDKIVANNMDYMKNEIFSCTLWGKPGIETLVSRFEGAARGSGWRARTSLRMLYRLFLISGWYNAK